MKSGPFHLPEDCSGTILVFGVVSGTWICSFGSPVQRLLFSAVSTFAVRTHALLARSYQDKLNLLPLSTVSSLCQSSFRVFSIATVQSQVGVTHEWSQMLRAVKWNTRSALRQMVLQVRESAFDMFFYLENCGDDRTASPAVNSLYILRAYL